MNVATGVVKFFQSEKGFGFIKPDDGNVDVFVHIRDVRGMQPLSEGMRVGFEEVMDQRKGKTKATDVRLL